MPSSKSINAPTELQLLTPSDLVLAATDDYPLAARLWASADASSPVSTALVNAGAGIGMRYYDRFACFLATNGIPTLVYDYRGIGQSRPHRAYL